MMDYDESNPESLMHKHGQVAIIVHKDQLSRKEKEVVRAATSIPESGILAVGKSHYVLFIAEEPDDYDEDLIDVTKIGDSEPVLIPVEPPVTEDTVQFFGTATDEPTLAQLEKLTVQELKNLAAKEELDMSDLKLKADLVGRLAAHFGVQI